MRVASREILPLFQVLLGGSKFKMSIRETDLALSDIDKVLGQLSRGDIGMDTVMRCRLDDDSAEIFTPLGLAVRAGRVDAAQALVSRGAKVDAVGLWQHERMDSLGGKITFEYQWTPLQLAAKTGDAAMARALIRVGAQNITCDYRGCQCANAHKPVQLPLVIAAQYGHLDCLAELVHAFGDADTAMLHATTREMVELLLAAGADVHAVDEDGRTGLLALALNDEAQPDAIRALIAAGADINATVTEESVSIASAVAWQADNNRSDRARLCLLIEAGANIEVKDYVSVAQDMRTAISGDEPEKTTVLAFARENRWLDVVAAWEARELREVMATPSRDVDTTPGL